MGMMCDDDDYDYEAENEAFNIIERRQSGFQIKRETAKHKLTAWVGLTAEDVHNTEGYEETREMYRFALAIEAKLKEKNT